MSSLLFNRAKRSLQLIEPGCERVFPAANNVDSHSGGHWPAGTWTFLALHPHEGDPPTSAYGSHGILIFDVDGRAGMGVHGGRDKVPDQLGRTGYLHATTGCIRTTEAAMAQIVEAHAADPIVLIEVRDA